MAAVPPAQLSAYAFSLPLHLTELTVGATVVCYFYPWQLQRSNSLIIDISNIRRFSQEYIVHKEERDNNEVKLNNLLKIIYGNSLNRIIIE
jgi:hypothetical protein